MNISYGYGHQLHGYWLQLWISVAATNIKYSRGYLAVPAIWSLGYRACLHSYGPSVEIP